jgi:type I restriction enzyme S subunit
MKQGWEIKKLGEVCDLQNGFAFKSTDYIEFSNTVNFRMSQIRPGGGVDLENNPKYLPDEYAITYKDYLLKEGDIVIAMTDMATETKILGVPTIVPSDSRNWLLNQRVGKLFNIDKSKVNIAFLKYILVSEPINEYYKKLGRGGLQINIGKQDILNAKIPLPPLPEQQRIVSILDEAFAAIAKAKAIAEQNLKNAKELFESYLQGVLKKKGEGWEEQLLEDCFKMKSGDNLTAKNMSEGEYPVFGGNGIAGYHNEYNLSGSNVIIGRVGALCGNVRHITENIWLTDNAFKVVDFKFDFDHSFLTYLLNHKDLRSYARQAAQPVISNSSLKDVVLNFPKSKKEQQTIVRQLDALRAETQKLEAVYQKKIADLEELKKSILQKAFAGELKTEKAVAV